jgi:hypothetical protein
MHLIDRLSTAQRVVVVVAIGLGLWVVGSYLVNLGSVVFYTVVPPMPIAPRTGLPPLARVGIWLVIIGLWALAATRVLGPPRGSGTPTDPADASGHTRR